LNFTHTTTLDWETDLCFDVEIDGHHFKVDSDPKYGGKDRGPRPKLLLLTALAGCTGMDVASIVQKMRMPFDTFQVEVGGVSADEEPRVYTHIHIKYIFTGSGADRDKIERAVKLSLEKYCPVAAMLSQVTELTHEIILNP
jgi:putative redox protein